MKTFKEARMAVSADYKISASGRKVHKMKKIADTEDDLDDKEDGKEVKEGAVPAHMQGKQKPYVSSDGKGNYEVLGNKGQTKATFTRGEHGSMAHGKAQAHLKAKYNEYMKEEAEEIDELTLHYNADDANNKVNANKMKAHLAKRGISASHQGGSQHRAILKVDTKHASDTAYVKNKVKGRYDVDVKEEVEMIDEATDKQEGRFIQLARLGLVDKADVSKLRIAMDQLKADKQLSTQQRSLLLNVMVDLVNLVTGDDAVFQRVKMDVQKEDTQIDEGENKKMKGKDPCWKGYQMVGMKDKGGKKVPNCVPEETEIKEGEEPPFDKPYTTVKPDVTDKSGAKHNGMSRVRHLAQLALKKQQEKQVAKSSNK